MTQPERHLLSLWDYGWLDHTELTLVPYKQPNEIIEAYLHSGYFATSFVGPELDDTGTIHGPFWRASIGAKDFHLIDSDEFYSQIRRIRQPEGFFEPADDDQWRAVEDLVSKLQRQFSWLIQLRLTEDDSDRFHEWGFVLSIFREFVLANPNSDRVARLVFGFD